MSPVFFDSGARNVYFSKEAKIQQCNSTAPKVRVVTATGQVQRSIGTVALSLTHIPDDLPRAGHVMPSFKHTLIRIVSINDTD